MVSDDTHRGRPPASLAVFLRAPAGKGVPRANQLGYSDEEAEQRRLVGRYLGTLDVGLARAYEQLVATQPSELRALTRSHRPARRECWRNARSRSKASASKATPLRADMRATGARRRAARAAHVV